MTISVGLFIVTIFSLVATIFGNPNAPLAQFLNRYVSWMLGVEVVVFVIVGLLSLLHDRRQALREWSAYEERQKARLLQSEKHPELRQAPPAPPTDAN